MYLDKAEERKLKLIFYIRYFLYLYPTSLLIFFLIWKFIDHKCLLCIHL